MNANAYGGQLAEVLEWVDVCTAAGSERRRPEQLGFAYRSSNLGAGEVVARASFRLSPADPEEVKATLAGMRERRREAQPSGIKTFGSTFKNPEDPRGRGPDGRTAARGRRLPRPAASAAPASPRSTPTSSRTRATATTADVLELMAEGRRRVHERFGVVLEPEVQHLGELRWPEGWEL